MNDELSANVTISHYRIISKIGAGGMGEVYRARDERLGRDVAIKMLPAEVATDNDRLKRFEQEAKATSALNHPNILTVYDIGEHDGVPFLVSELLEGEELRDRLNEGAIPLRKTIDYAQQIVSGLSAAHERGITHRDLKPENLFITKDDRVKILDFGLAKLREAPTNVQGSEDATKKALTGPGIVMGTVGYMSPEQVRGSMADHRSDIFSFGVILYEMLTGTRAFEGESVVETMHSILKEDVPEVEENSAVRIPPALDKLMRRCLEKKPDHRFHSAHDLGFALDALASPTSSSGSGLTVAAKALRDDAEPIRSNRFSRAAFVAAAVFLIAAVAFAVLYFRRPETHASMMRFAVPAPERTSYSPSFAISPNGQSVAFVALSESGLTTLWVRPLNSLQARLFPGSEGAAFPFWSPDSRTIAYFAGGKLKKVDANGGPAQSLTEVSADTRGGTWAPDGTIIFSPNTTSPLLKIASTGGAVSELTKVDPEIHSSHRWPSMLPDGRHFLFFGRGPVLDKQGIYVGSLDSAETKFILQTDIAARYAETNGKGYLLFMREGTLVAQGFDPSAFTLSGDAIPLVEKVLAFPGEVGPTAYASFSAEAGNLIYRNGDEQTTRLTWFDRSGKSLGVVSEPSGYHEPTLSKDDTKVLYGRTDSSGGQDVYMQDLVRGNNMRLTFDPSADSTPVLSPDEKQVVFFSNRAGKNGIYRKSSSGAGEDELLMTETIGAYPDSWSSDGKYLLYERVADTRTRVDLWILPMTGEPKPFPYLDGEFEEAHGQFSPDGKWVAYASNQSGRSEVYVRSFPNGSGMWQISNNGGDQPQWRSDGKEIFYMAADRRLTAVPVSGSSTFEVGRPEVLFETAVPQTGITDDRNTYVPSRDGQRFLVNALAESAYLEPLIVILNWGGELKQ